MKDYVAENERILNEWRKSNEEHGETRFADDGIMFRGQIDDNGTERYESDNNQENKLALGGLCGADGCRCLSKDLDMIAC